MKKSAIQGDGPRIGVYVCHCGLNIARTVDCEKVAAQGASLPGVVVSRDIQYACSEPGQQSMKDDIAEFGLDRVVIASCSPRLHEPTFRQMLESAGLNPYLLEMANLREQCSWVHMNEPEAATQKAVDLVRMAVARAEKLEALEATKIPLTKRTLVIGGGIAGMQAAMTAWQNGHRVILCEKSGELGGNILCERDVAFKERLHDYIEQQKALIARSTIDLRLNTKVTPEYAKSLRPDVVVL
jgi:heterodisulfide reductase subunit A